LEEQKKKEEEEEIAAAAALLEAAPILDPNCIYMQISGEEQM